MTYINNLPSSSSSMRILFLALYSSHVTSSTFDAYYISPNKLSWNDANAYCHDICDSELASIHSIDQHQFITQQDALAIETDYGNNNLWIGLSTTALDTYHWTDGTPVDYTHESLPSLLSVPGNNTSCIAIDKSSFSWMHANCSEHSRFVCNTCNSRINRFVLIHEHLNYSAALQFCELEVRSSLASVHSDAEYYMTKTLVGYDSSWSTWIGLNDLHANDSHSMMDGVRDFVWTDGTSFDYGVLPAKYYGEVPWKPEEPNNAQEQCIAMYTEHRWWNDVNCVSGNARYTFLCNMPSELCEPANWFIPTDSSWVVDGCDAYSAGAVAEDQLMMNRRQFVNGNSRLVVEYTSAVLSRSGSAVDSDDEHVHGVRIYDDECQFYYFVSVSDKWVVSLGTEQFIMTQVQLNDSQFQVGVFYRLRLTVESRVIFTVEINDVTYIDRLRDWSVAYSAVNNPTLSGYIGLYSHQASVHAKSLYISGATVPSSQVAPVSCLTPDPTIHPTVMPTTNVPTTTPSNTPTLLPTQQPSVPATTLVPSADTSSTSIPVELEYCVTIVLGLSQQPANLSLMVDSLIDMAQSIVLSSMNATNCSEPVPTIAHVQHSSSTTSINLTLCTCTPDEQVFLAQNLRLTLPTAIAGQNFTISTSVQSDAGDHVFNATVVGPISWSAPTEKILYVQNPPISDPVSGEPDSFSLLWFGIFMMIGGIIMCLVCIILGLLCRLKTTTKPAEVQCHDQDEHHTCGGNIEMKATAARGIRAHRFVPLPSTSSHSLMSLPMSSVRVNNGSITPIDENIPRHMHDAIDLAVAVDLELVQAGNDFDFNEDDSDDENESLWEVRSARSNIEPEGVNNTTQTPQIKNSI